MRHRISRTAALAAAACLVLPASAGADVVVDFEGLAPETAVTDQYAGAGGAGQGVVFGPLPGAGGNGFRPVVKSADPSLANSGTQVADISLCNNGECGGEFYPAYTTATFENPRKRVSVRVGFAGTLGAPCTVVDNTGCAEVTLQGYDSNGNPVGSPSSAMVYSGQGFRTPLQIEQPTATIRGFSLRARDSQDLNEPVRIDDVAFDEVTTPPPPDFTLTPESRSLDVYQGGSVRNRISIARTGGSSGDVSFSISGLPDGVHARFAPNPAGGAATDLILRADPGAASTNFQERTLIVTGSPATAAVGPATRSFPIGLEVREALDPACVAIDGSFQPIPDEIVRVDSESGLLAELAKSGSRRIVLAHRTEPYDLTGNFDLDLHEGVQLVGERGAFGRLPVIHDRSEESHRLFRIAANDVCVDGIHFKGSTADGGVRGTPWRHAIGLDEGPADSGRNVLITNNEFSHWGRGAGVEVNGAISCRDPKPVGDCPYDEAQEACPAPPDETCDWMRPEEVGLAKVERNYFHSGEFMYGVVIGGSSYATIQGNVFDSVRHPVTSSGYAYSGYVARFNYSLNGGYTYGDNGYWASHFDVHGTGTPEGRPDGHYDGGWAGEYHEVAYNTVRGEQDYGGFLGIAEKTRPAFGLRGKTLQVSDFHDNVVVHDDAGEALSVKDSGGEMSPAEWPKQNLRWRGNRYDTDYSTEIAVGRFDADSYADVFLANGTGWFYSSGGISPWKFLRASNKRIKDLAFADVDNDTFTDVLYRESTGRLGYVRSGRAPDVTWFTSVPVPISQLRAGDFDGDGRTDLFYTRGKQWNVRYAASGAWTPTQTSDKPIDRLLFGNFDDVPGTDVAGVNRNEWSYSSGSTQSWARLGPKRKDSFEGAVAADFDGTGRTDIAFGGDKWRYSPNGTDPLATLNKEPKFGLRQVATGYLDGTRKAGVAGFSGNRLRNWLGIGRGHAASPQNMR